jgi:site-specific DNA-methyltransferase (adenine-specific)
VAQAIIDRYYPDLGRNHFVIEASCGDGRFLQAIPADVPALGVEIDPGLAALAAVRTGREVLVGDFRTVRIDRSATHIIGNPPFQLDVIDDFLDRAHDLLVEGGKVGWILPCYALQTARRVVSYAYRWGLQQDIIPRNIFPNLQQPLTFVRFTKGRSRVLVGFALYDETLGVHGLDEATQNILQHGGSGGAVWREAIGETLRRLGGRANLKTLYQAMESRRPTGNRFWREKIRQTLYRYPGTFQPNDGEWSLAA